MDSVLHRLSGEFGEEPLEAEKKRGKKLKGRDIGYALAARSCEGAKLRGGMYRHSP